MSTHDSPTLVRATGIAPVEGSETPAADRRRLRATVDALETEVAELKTRLRARERELAAAREPEASTEAGYWRGCGRSIGRSRRSARCRSRR